MTARFDAAGIASSATILDRSAAGAQVACGEAGFHQKALPAAARHWSRLRPAARLVRRRGGRVRVHPPGGQRGLAGERALQAIAAAWQKHQAAREQS